MRIITAILATAITLTSFSQAPEAFKYQAVVRDVSGNILSNQAVGLQLIIRQGSAGGTPVYSESFSTLTNGYGLVNLEIGTGSTTDDFIMIDWANGPYFMETAVDVTGGTAYMVMGTSQLMSVPYALHAKTAENVTNDLVNDADADPSNEIQTLTLSGSNLTISGGNTVTLSVGGGGPQFVSPINLYSYSANGTTVNNTFNADINSTLGVTTSAVILYVEFLGDNGTGSYGTPSRCVIGATSGANTYEVCEWKFDVSTGASWGIGSSSSQIILPVGATGLIDFDNLILRGSLKVDIVGYY